MPLYIFLTIILWLFVLELKRRAGVSRALWAVVVWAVVIGSRPVSTWFNFGGGVGSASEAYDEGNPFERVIYFILIGYGLFVISRRGVQFRTVIRENKWLFLFFLYWGLSVVWSEHPFVALKRWVKDIGNIVMVLVILTERNPVEAAKAVFARCSCLLVPLSVLFIKCYSNLGRAYHTFTGEMEYTGVATHKNSLGVLVLVCGLFQMWDFVDRWRNRTKPRSWIFVGSDVVLMLMTTWLLLTSHSATALGCTVGGIIIYFGLRLPAVRSRVGDLGIYGIVGGLSFWLLNSVFDIAKLVVVDILGRDLTLTTRTEVWPMLIEQSESLLFGSGFNSFWAGERLATIYGQMGIIQAHNGYLETYLNGGVIGVMLLVVLLFTAGIALKGELVLGSDFARMKFMFLIIAVIYDFTEAAFNKMGLVWFVLLLAILRYPSLSRSNSGTPSVHPNVKSSATA